MAESTPLSPAEAEAARRLFWQNFMRQVLTALSVETMRRAERQRGLYYPADEDLPAKPEGAPAIPERGNLFDGRLAVLTHAGERIAIGEVSPVLACGLSDPGRRALSMAVECSIFQIRTPTGEVFTLPLEQIRGFHALSPELLAHLEAVAREHEEPSVQEEELPFGFAAFTSLAQQRGGEAGG
ncbi:MAG: hypothetical protein ACF8R7_15230 [Phycisphaerales bacterium JB039]